MFKTVKIENFRSFRQFELNELGRINLLVGENNSGKTSLLEAIHLLSSRGHPQAFRELMSSRGEYIIRENQAGHNYDIRHLFHGHNFDVGSKFSIQGGTKKSNFSEKLLVSIAEPNPRNSQKVDEDSFEDRLGGDSENPEDILNVNELNFIVQWSYDQDYKDWNIQQLSSQGELPWRAMARHALSRSTKDNNLNRNFLPCKGVSVAKVIDWFDQIVLTPEEDNVYEALRIIEPNIKRIATVNNSKTSEGMSAQKGFAVLIDDYRVPMGSMGDGIWRILGLVLASIKASNGFLLVDEIDTGLHFTAMTDMWKLIWEIAKRLNIQVFATTHSSDCWKCLAAIARRYETTDDDGITIQRIERDKPEGIVFSEEEMVLASDMGIEVR